MSTTLAEKLTSYASTLDVRAWDPSHRDPSMWSEGLRKTFQKQILSRELLGQLVEDCLALSVETPKEYLFFCQRVFSVVLLYRYSYYSVSEMKQTLSTLYLKLIKYQYLKGLQLTSLYKELIGFFLEEPVESLGIQLSSQGIALIAHEGLLPEYHLPHLIKNAELALIAGMFSLVKENRELLKKALEISEWLSHFVEEGRGFPEGLWMEEGDFSPAALSLLSALLFQFASFFSSSSGMQEAHQAITKIFIELPSQDLGVLYPLLYLFMLEVTQQHSSLLVAAEQETLALKKKSFKYLGYGTHCYQDFSCYCTASGAGSGFAGFAKGSVRITSIGPHLGALGEMQKYGIYRVPLMQQTPFKDVHLEQREGMLAFSGWTGVVAGNSVRPTPGTSSLHIEMSVKEKRALLKTKWVNFQESPEMFLVFFIRGSKAVVDKNYHLHPDTLDRYQGKASEISVQDQGISLNIKTEGARPMQVIPLAGDDHFWGAQFLVAYSFPQNETLLFEIT